jgi:hypothetical protein
MIKFIESPLKNPFYEEDELDQEHIEEFLRQKLMGIKVEKEHEDTYEYLKNIFSENGLDIPMSLDEFAEMIALAHLKEDLLYYDHLKEMEDQYK